MAMEVQVASTFVEQERGTNTNGLKDLDDDGREKRTGTWLTASAHIITAVIGSGVLSLAWAIAQLGWVTGPIVLIVFALITYMTSTMLADGYRAPDPVTGTRNYTYMDVVRAHLGGRKVQLCGLAQYINLVGITIGYTITASISIVAVKRAICFHNNGHGAKCNISNYPAMGIFCAFQIVLSQIPNFHKLSWLSIVAAVMSFGYAFIGVGLSIAKAITDASHVKTTITGTIVGVDASSTEKLWKTFQALGNIAFAYAFATVLVEIQDTLKSSPPENKSMKRATLVGCSITTIFYSLCGLIGYAAFGNEAPGNFLTGFGFYEPFWLVGIGNIFIVVHLIAAYQVFAQPIYRFVESRCHKRWPESNFITGERVMEIPCIGQYNLSVFRLVWRTIYVIISVLIAMIFPFFNDFVGLLGAVSFYPLTVYFPIEIHIAQSKMKTYSLSWVWLKILSMLCLVVSIVAAAGSIEGLIQSVKTYKPFQTQD